jgi:hypothetical protein
MWAQTNDLRSGRSKRAVTNRGEDVNKAGVSHFKDWRASTAGCEGTRSASNGGGDVGDAGSGVGTMGRWDGASRGREGNRQERRATGDGQQGRVEGSQARRFVEQATISAHTQT